ncbi:PH and SEC7 domain-containing protein 4 isoform X2 [Archocentrus centrarchus]|uniref:PH and SEC7 domain-containing protein 4 isoform X2 n=1 Tax=Archocentrus centrarchus TaxID=63155 RepID=UPI0011EA11DF|nr:PH and SEC7 domain-containing protein 4-like isoform X2 [Archocentrus centrarchus]
MEEENVCTSLTVVTDSLLQQPLHGSCNSLGQQSINGEEEAVILSDQVCLTPKEGHETSEEAEQWEQMIWPVCHVNCTSPPLSFATVQWDMPDPTAEQPPLVTDSSSANELDFTDGRAVTNLGSTSPSFHESEEDVSAEPFKLRDREEQDELDSPLLNSEPEWTGSDTEPCDAADVQELETRGKEDELVDSNNDSSRAESEEEEGRSVTSHPAETEELIKIAQEIEGLEEDVDSFVNLKLEEEQKEASVLLTGQSGESEEKQTSANGDETEEETEEENEERGEVEEGQSEANASCCEESVSRLMNVEVPAELLPTDDGGVSIDLDKLLDLPPSELLEENLQFRAEEDDDILERLHEDLTSQTEVLEMCEDGEEKVDPEQPEAVDNNKEAVLQEAENAERIENSQEMVEKLEDLNSLVQLDCDQITLQDTEASLQPEHSESEQLEVTENPEQMPAEGSHETEVEHSEDLDHLEPPQHLEESPEVELTDQLTQPEDAEQPEESPQLEQTVCTEAADPGEPEEQEQTVPSEDKQSVNATESQEELNQEDKQGETSDPAGDVRATEDEDLQTVVANGKQPTILMNGGEVDREKARILAEKLFKLDEIQPGDVVKHLDKDNDFSRAVGEEYLKFFDFTSQTLDHSLRSFLKVVVLIGETQERERVLQHFSCRFHQCNPNSFSSSGAVLALTCALMLLNTDLHGQHVGKSMSSSKFVSNLDGMNDGGNFSKDLLKSLYNSIKNEPLEWAVDEEELKKVVNEDQGEDAPLRLKANPFLDVPHDKKAVVVKQGFLQRKLHADIDGKRTPWGKRGWKTFDGVLKGMVLYLQKDDYRRDLHTNEEVVSVHHSLAEPAADYTKKPHVFRLQTADWRVFLLQAASKVEMNSWISRINLVSALHSSPPFPAAVGSQRKFCRPILPASQSAQTLERQLQSHARMLETFKSDLEYQEQNAPEGRKAKSRDLEEHRVRAEYLQHEICRYETYIQVLEAWRSMNKTGELNPADLNLFDKAVCADSLGEEEDEEGMLKKSHSSPSLELEVATPTVVKVRRNISERRTYRKAIIPRFNKEV